MMMNFWTSSVGEVTGKAADAFAKSFKQIPDGTTSLARIESFVNAEYEGNKYLNIDWVLTGGDFKGQKVSHKLKVYGDPKSKEPEKARLRALNMFKLLYDLFGISPKHANEPTNTDLLVFVGGIAGIKIRETDANEQGKQYNWVSEVHNAKGFKCETGLHIVVSKSASTPVHHGIESAFSRNENSIEADNLDDDIPF